MKGVTHGLFMLSENTHAYDPINKIIHCYAGDYITPTSRILMQLRTGRDIKHIYL